MTKRTLAPTPHEMKMALNVHFSRTNPKPAFDSLDAGEKSLIRIKAVLTANNGKGAFISGNSNHFAKEHGRKEHGITSMATLRKRVYEDPNYDTNPVYTFFVDSVCEKYGLSKLWVLEGKGPALRYNEPTQQHIEQVLNGQSAWAKRAKEEGLDEVYEGIAACMRFEAFRIANPSIGTQADAAKATGYGNGPSFIKAFGNTNPVQHFQKLEQTYGLSREWLETGKGNMLVEQSQNMDIPIEALELPRGAKLPQNITFNVSNQRYDPTNKVMEAELSTTIQFQVGSQGLGA